MSRSRIYFVSDVHGSNRCFKKFLNSAKFYKADILILGGDITGKVMAPVVEEGDSYKCSYLGEEVDFRTSNEMEDFRKRAGDAGAYAPMVSKRAFGELEADPQKVKDLFRKLMIERVSQWTRLAEEKLGKTTVRCYISPGNDDILEIDSVLSSSDYVINPEGRVVNLDGSREMITLGYTNRTPWDSPREVDEKDLARKISDMADKVTERKSAVFNIHVPPIDTTIDQAPRLDGDLKVVTKGGSVEMFSAGSSACRAAIMKYQPLLGLHGHIHESRGTAKLGRTLCANPGSEYGEGILDGFLVDVEGDEIKSFILTSG